MKKAALYSTLILLLAPIAPIASATDSISTIDHVERSRQLAAAKALEWTRLFADLKATNNITIAIAKAEYAYELLGVIDLKPKDNLLRARYKASDGREYIAIIDPTTIVLIKESPKKTN